MHYSHLQWLLQTRCHFTLAYSFSSCSAACMILIYFLESICIGYCDLGVIRQAEEPFPCSFAVPPLPAANVPCVRVEGDQLGSAVKPVWALVQPAPGMAAQSSGGRLTARRVFANDGLAVACEQRSLPSPVSNMLQREDLKTKMLALNFKKSR